MPYYKAVFRLLGGTELQADRGHVPDSFFEAIKKVTVQDIVNIHEGGFILSTEMHQKLSVPDTFTSYAIAGLNAPQGTDKDPEFRAALLEKLKFANHARPLEIHYNYQIFIMEHIEEFPEDD
jgi:hypothetical protein